MKGRGKKVGEIKRRGEATGGTSEENTFVEISGRGRERGKKERQNRTGGGGEKEVWMIKKNIQTICCD